MTAVDQMVGGRPDAGWDVLASDGAVVRIRPLREDDESALEAMNQRVSEPPTTAGPGWCARRMRAARA